MTLDCTQGEKVEITFDRAGMESKATLSRMPVAYVQVVNEKTYKRGTMRMRVEERNLSNESWQILIFTSVCVSLCAARTTHAPRVSESPVGLMCIAHYTSEQSIRDIFDMMAQTQQHAREMQDDVAFELTDEVPIKLLFWSNTKIGVY